ncbi:MAG: cytochrome b/b6 domain-containing protein [Candidatus Hodarchaeota archaeon]
MSENKSDLTEERKEEKTELHTEEEIEKEKKIVSLPKDEETEVGELKKDEKIETIEVKKEEEKEAIEVQEEEPQTVELQKEKEKRIELKEEKKAEIPEAMTITAQRYDMFERTHHWVHLGAMLIFFLTGFEIFIKVYFIGDYLTTRSFHIILGIFIFTWDMILYLAFLIKTQKISEVILVPRDILDMLIMVLCALKILPESKYPDYGFYNPDTGHYESKYNPGQKLLATSNLIMLTLIGLTGFILAEELAPGSTGIFGILGLLIGPMQALAIDTRFIHFLLYVYFLATTIIHAYMAVLPINVQNLRGMIFGREEIPLIYHPTHQLASSEKKST